MKIDEAKLYLEHTSKDDFNLEEWQQNNRYKAIQVVLEEIERLKEEYIMLQNASDEVEEEKDKEIERLTFESTKWESKFYCVYSTNNIFNFKLGVDKE